VKFGIMPTYRTGAAEAPEYATGLAELAEELGFESIWSAEHVVMPDQYSSRYPYSKDGRMPIPDEPVPDPIIWNTWAAAATNRLVVGTAMVILPQHNPVVFAKSVASLDALSGGRVILGVGVGWLREEMDAVGTDWRTRGERADESIHAMRALWTQPIASYEGRHVSFERVKCNPRPANPAGVPIHIGGHSPAAARRAGRLGDGFLPLGGSIEALGGLFDIVRETAREAGRDPDAIELTSMGPASFEAARAAEEAGIHRLLIGSGGADLEKVRRSCGEFSEKVIAKLG
jgi:probable F420-dependent oxidoreductase